MTAKTPTSTASLSDAARGVACWLGQGARLGLDLLGSVQLPSAPRTGASCEIPPPCWAPQPLGSVTTRACPGTKSVVRIRVTNSDMVSRTINVTTTGGADAAKVDSASITLDPLEEGEVVLSFEVPPADANGEERKLIVWVDGCQRHYLRWTIVSTCTGQDCCAEIAVDDGPDLVHHWYDHFYCQRDCIHD